MIPTPMKSFNVWALLILITFSASATDVMTYQPAEGDKVPPRGWWGQVPDTVSVVKHGETPVLRFEQSDANKSQLIHRRVKLPEGLAEVQVVLTAGAQGIEAEAQPPRGGTLLLAFEDAQKKAIEFRSLRLKGDTDGPIEKSGVYPVPEGATHLKLSLGLFKASGRLDVAGIVVRPPAADDGAGASTNGDRPLGEALVKVLDPAMDVTAVQGVVREANRALSNGQGVTLRFNPGVYRIPANVLAFEQSGNAPLTLEADAPDTVSLRGSVTQNAELDASPDQWEPVAGHPGVFRIDWPYRHGLTMGYWGHRYGFPFRREAKRSELLVINGKVMVPREIERYRWVDPDGPFIHMNRKAGNSPGKYVYEGIVDGDLSTLRYGEFAVTDRNDTEGPLRKSMFVRLPKGMSWDAVASVEFAGGMGDHDAIIKVAGRSNVTLKNLTVEHFGGDMLSEAVSLIEVDNYRIEGCDFSRNGGRGLLLTRCKDGVLIDSKFDENGQKGVNAGTLEGLRIERCDMNWNNWRGRYGFIGFDSAAIKFGSSRNVTIVDSNFVGNLTGAVWFDINNTDVLVERVFVYGNFRPGVEFELTTKPDTGRSTLRNSVVGENFSYGVFISDSRVNTVEGNVIFNNGSGTFGPGILSLYPQDQIGYTHNPGRGPRDAKTWGTNRITNNLIYDADGFNLFGVVYTKTPPAQYRELLSTMEIGGNVYAHGKRSDVFMLPDHSHADFDTWMQQARAAGVKVTGSERFIMEQMPFGRDADGLLMQRVRETGVDIPWDLVEEWRARGGHPSREEYQGLPMDDDEA